MNSGDFWWISNFSEAEIGEQFHTPVKMCQNNSPCCRVSKTWIWGEVAKMYQAQKPNFDGRWFLPNLPRPQWKDCEKNALLGLRKRFKLAVNLRPSKVHGILLWMSFFPNSTWLDVEMFVIFGVFLVSIAVYLGLESHAVNVLHKSLEL